MITVLWRSVVVSAFAFWQGGFTFYAAVVVPIGTEVLGSAMEQGTITRRVTVWLNVAGSAALLLFAIDNVVSRDPARWRKVARWLAWLGMAAALGVLVWLHPRMTELLDTERLDPDLVHSFRRHHRWYLWISTAQWAMGVSYFVCVLATWQARARLGR
jgi:hypothetical protein